MFADVVHRKSVSAGGLDGWGWRELKVLPPSWFDELARILLCIVFGPLLVWVSWMSGSSLGSQTLSSVLGGSWIG